MPPTSPITPSTPTTVRFPFAEAHDSPIILPAPTSVRVSRCHQRAHTTIDLPPLSIRTDSTSPSRSSTFLPFLKPSRDRSTSPDRVLPSEAAEFSVDSSEVGSVKQRSGKVDKLAGWFEGTSEPVKIGLVPSPSKEQLNPFFEPQKIQQIFSASTESVDKLTKRPSSRPRMAPRQPTQSASRFSFFRKPSQVQIKPDPLASDEMAQLDIHTSLFPAGIIDEFSPAAFKNLQMNAEGTAKKLQSGYREAASALKAISSEKSIQSDELEAAQTRNEHLKLQLTEMAEKAAVQEKTIAHLQSELQTARTVRLVPPENYYPTTPQRPKHRNRTSDASTLNESESGSDTSSGMSVFSEAGDNMSSPGTSIAASPVLKSAVMFRPPQSSSFDHNSLVRKYEAMQVLECQKCHGVKHNEAWDVVNVMKAQSLALKSRIEELEGAQSDALDFLSSVDLAS